MERDVHSPPEGMHLFCRTGYSRDASGKGEGPFTQLPTLPLEPAQLEPLLTFLLTALAVHDLFGTLPKVALLAVVALPSGPLLRQSFD